MLFLCAMSQIFTKSYRAACSFLGAAALLTMVSCSKGSDKKSNVTTRLKDRYIKTWDASDQCNFSTSANYKIDITDNAGGEDRLKISNLQNTGGTVDGIVSTIGDITIPGQSYLKSDTTIQGSMSYDSTFKVMSFNLNYTYNGITIKSCSGTAY